VRFKLSIALVACAALAACRTTSEIPLAANVWQFETSAQGLLFTHGSDKATLKKVAQRTISQGYSHFIIVDGASQSGSVYVGSTPTTVNARYSADHSFYGTGNYLSGTTSGTAYGTVTPGTPVYAPTRNLKLTVVMFKEGDPQAANALSAAAILAEK